MKSSQKSHEYHAKLTIFTGSVGFFVWGYTNSISNSVLFFLRDFVFHEVSSTEISLIASIITIGAALGAYVGGKLASQLGRRKGLLLGDVTFLVATVFTLFESYRMILFGRLIQGVVVGVNSVIGPLYLNEMVPKQIRGVAGTINIFFLNVGIVVANMLGFFVPKSLEKGEESIAWKIAYGLGALLIIVRVYIFLELRDRETPTYHVNLNQIGEAKLTIREWIADNYEEITEELIKDRDLQRSKKEEVTFRELFSPKYRNVFLMGVVTAAMFQLCGLNVMMVFPNVVFGAGIDPNDFNWAIQMSFYMSILNTVSKLLCSYLVQKYGRRDPLVYGLVVTAGFMFLYSIIVFNDSEANRFAKFLMLIWPIPFSITVGGMALLYISEILPTIGIVVSTQVIWILAFIIVQSFLKVKEIIGLGGVFLFFAICSFAASGYFYKYAIETKGKSKSEIMMEFMKNSGPFSCSDSSSNISTEIELKALLLPKNQ